MGMRKCKECGEEMSKDAKACPKCGKDSRNFFKKHPILSVLGILILFCIVVSASGDNNEEISKNTLSTGNNNTQINDVNKKTEYNVGEIYEDNYVAVKYEAKNENFTGYNQYADIKNGYKVLQATFEFENVGTTDKLVSAYDFSCYADGYDCESFYSIDDSGFSSNLSSGKKTKGSVYFEVPINAEEITIEYEADYWSSEKVVFIVK